jgi:hypothetical protein
MPQVKLELVLSGKHKSTGNGGEKLKPECVKWQESQHRHRYR